MNLATLVGRILLPANFFQLFFYELIDQYKKIKPLIIEALFIYFYFEKFEILSFTELPAFHFAFPPAQLLSFYV